MITEGIYHVGGSQNSHPYDANVFVIDCGKELVLIDSGSGLATARIIENIDECGLFSQRISTVILTHCHIDHSGGAAQLRERFGAKLVMHHLDAEVLECADSIRSAANWYDIPLEPLRIDEHLRNKETPLAIGNQKILCLHTPGHTPGSLSVLWEGNNKRVLFGQDIHGPFLPAFASDIALWRESMKELLALRPDILCEGHLGNFAPFSKVADFIWSCLQEHTIEEKL